MTQKFLVQQDLLPICRDLALIELERVSFLNNIF
jgi:hypothetical protein